MPPASRAARYRKWDFNFSSYWAIEDHKVRQQHLLDYFIQCGTLEPSITMITLDVMKKIEQDDVIKNPFAFGEKWVHLNKNLNSLRQCVTAELLFIFGNQKLLSGMLRTK